MAIGKVNYKTGQNLEPIASAITSMNQSSTKKDKPVEMAQKIKAISTDATATEGNVLNGQTFYAGGSKQTGNMPNNGAWSSSLDVNDTVTIPKGYHDGNGKVTQNIEKRGSISSPVEILGTNPLYVKIDEGYYPYNVAFGYPRIKVPLSDLRGLGFALQSEVDAMTNDRNNWMNVANNRVPYTFQNYPYIKNKTAVGTITLAFTHFCKIRIRVAESDENEDFVPIFLLRHPNGTTSISLPYAYASVYSSYFSLYDSSEVCKASTVVSSVSSFFSMSLNTTYELQARVQGDWFYLNITPTSTGLTISCKKISYTGDSYITAWCC